MSYINPIDIIVNILLKSNNDIIITNQDFKNHIRKRYIDFRKLIYRRSKDIDRRYYEKNSQVILARNKQYYRDNKPRIQKVHYLRYLSIKDDPEYKKRRREYYQKNKARYNELRRINRAKAKLKCP